MPAEVDCTLTSPPYATVTVPPGRIDLLLPLSYILNNKSLPVFGSTNFTVKANANYDVTMPSQIELIHTDGVSKQKVVVVTLWLTYGGGSANDDNDDGVLELAIPGMASTVCTVQASVSPTGRTSWSLMDKAGVYSGQIPITLSAQ